MSEPPISSISGFESGQHVIPAAGQEGSYALKIRQDPADPVYIDWTFHDGEPVLIDQRASFAKSRFVRLAVWVEEDGTLRVRLGQWGGMVDRKLNDPDQGKEG